MSLGTWLLALLPSLVARCLLALGFSVVSIIGVDAALTGLKSSAIAAFSSMPANMLNFMLYMWIGKGIGIIFGAITAKMALWAIQNATSLLGKAPS